MKNKIIVDGDLYCYRLTSAAETEIDWGDDFWTLHCNARPLYHLFDGEMGALEKKFQSPISMIAFSSKGNFRKSIDANYKSGRKKSRKPLAYKAMVEWVQTQYTTLTIKDLEADDVLGLQSRGSIIVSWDKDMRQVPGMHYNPVTDEQFEVTADEGYRYFLTQTLTGDRVDGYTGLPGCGPVKAERILNADCSWAAVVRAYADEGLTEKDALKQARLAYILKNPNDYNKQSEYVKLWTP